MGSRDKQRDCGEREGTSSLQGNVNTLKTEDEETKGEEEKKYSEDAHEEETNKWTKLNEIAGSEKEREEEKTNCL